MKLDILAIGVHPDDIEISAAGTIMKHIDAGYKIGLLDLTQGELGTRGSAEIRSEEANMAAEKMGVQFRHILKMADGFFENNREHQMQIVQFIRKYQPEIILCNALNDRHPDHGRSSKLVSDACFLSGLTKVESEFEGSKQEAWRPKAVYHYLQDRYIKPDFLVDITGYMESKEEVLRCYRSQFYNEGSSEPITYISTPEFFNSIKHRAAEFGRQIGVQYAEAYNVERLFGVKNLFDLI